ncbi:MAG TPA: hypothetical protein VGM98_25150 [Schlesneria sp.]|jgi:hypothetical protein
MTYRPVSRFAVAAVLIAPLGAIGLAMPEAIAFAVPAICCAALGLYEIYKYHFAGRRLAIVGLMTAVTCAVCIPIWHYVSFHSETLADYRREDFGDLVKRKDLSSIEGLKTCLKGYANITTDWPTSPARTFLFSPEGDWGTKNAIRVQLTSDQGWRPTLDGLAVSGTLIRNEAWIKGGDEPKYLFRTSLIRPARSSVQIGHRSGHGC